MHSFSSNRLYTVKYSSWGESVRSTPLEVKDSGARGTGGVADEEAYTVHSINIVSQRHYSVARCLNSCVGNVFGLHTMYVSFPSAHKLVK
jgi:hypothetical protein